MVILPGARPRYRVFVSAKGNAFMAELADVLAAGLRDLGREVELRTDLPVAKAGCVDIVVAPHELFHLLGEHDEARRQRAAVHCVCVTVEQPATSWFETSYLYARRARLVLDINEMGAWALRERGVRARFLQLGYHRSWDAWGGNDAAERPIDILFLCSLNRRREVFFARNAAKLATLDCRLQVFDPSAPVLAGASGAVFGREKYQLLARSKVLVNVHQNDTGYFEWHRAVQAIANGCLLISEPSFGSQPLLPGMDFIEADTEVLVDAALAFLANPAKRAEVTRAAYGSLKTGLSLVDALAGVLSDLDACAAVADEPEPSRQPLRLPGRAQAAGAWGEARRDFEPLGLAAGIKRALLAQTALRRQLEALEARLDSRTPDGYDVSQTPAYEDFRPEVTVVVPLYNYAHYVVEAVESVLQSEEVAVEVLVIDDHSTDGSGDIVSEFMRRHPEYPIALVSRHVNAGLSAARNLGFSLARAGEVFLLDADNAVYPAALRKLRAALASGGAGFAYCIAEKFGEAVGLLSAFPWDVTRLLRSNHIDAMALVRRETWEQAGGFDPQVDANFGGWEDWDFWLRLAQRGISGAFVPEILTRYRTHGRSMLGVVNLETASIERYFRAKYASLPWPAVEEAT